VSNCLSTIPVCGILPSASITHLSSMPVIVRGAHHREAKRGRILQVEGELVSRKRLEELAPEQFSSILILADESATFSTADVDQVCPMSILSQKIEELLAG